MPWLRAAGTSVRSLAVDPPGVAFAFGAAGDAHPRYRRDRRQGFATKPHRADLLQVLQAGDLAGRVTLQCQRQIVGCDAATVIGDADAPHATLLERDLDRSCASIGCVLEHFA